MTELKNAPTAGPAAVADGDELTPRRWWVLVVLATAQLMVVLDATIVNIALPRAQLDLGFSNDQRQWVVTGYALAFGGLLLLGGRLGDLLGRKRTFIVGLTGFAVASALGGAASSFALLVAARGGQGVFAALLAPAALSLVSTTFTEPGERARAFAIFGAIAGGGGAVGLILGGALTEWTSWRWCLFVNVLLAVPAIFAALALIPNRRPITRARLDVVGTLTVTLGLFGLVYGFSRAEAHGWGTFSTLGWLIAGALLLITFVIVEARSSNALLPLRIVLDRDRGSSFLSMFLVGAGLFAVFLFLTYYMQGSLSYTPIQTGLAFLPMMVGLSLAAQVASRVTAKIGPRAVAPVGMLLAAGGMLLFTQLSLDSDYVTGVLPGLLVTGIGLGLVLAPSIQTAVSGIDPVDAGVGSALVSTAQQVGGSIGTALFSTLAASTVTSYLGDHAGAQAEATLHGYLAVFAGAAGVFLAGAVLSGLLLRSGVQEPSDTVVIAH